MGKSYCISRGGGWGEGEVTIALGSIYVVNLVVCVSVYAYASRMRIIFHISPKFWRGHKKTTQFFDL